MICAPDHTTEVNAAAAAAGVVMGLGLTGKWIVASTEFTSDPKPPLAVRRRR